MGGGDGRRLVIPITPSSFRWQKRSPGIAPSVPPRPRRAPRARRALCDQVQGRGRSSPPIGNRHRRPRGTARGPFYRRPRDPGISAECRNSSGSPIFAEIPARSFSDHSAPRQPLDPALPTRTPAGRHPLLRPIASQRRHQARSCSSPRTPRDGVPPLPPDAPRIWPTRLQTPILFMLDLDIGMNDWLVEPLGLGRGPGLRTAAKVMDRRDARSRGRNSARYPRRRR